MTHDPPPPGLAREVLNWLTAAAFLTAALSVGIACTPPPAPATNPPATNLAADAVADLRRTKPAALSGPLTDLLATTREKVVPTQAHPLVGKPAPEFALADVDDKTVRLTDLVARGPVVVVFYYGYSCDHCVSQLFGLNEDLKYFRELGCTVVAVSEDAPAHTRGKYAEYGAFGFPVVSDPDNRVAQRYGVYTPKTADRPRWRAHGTFVLDRSGTVRWAATGSEPFTHTPTLLAELAKADGKLPAPNDPRPRSTP